MKNIPDNYRRLKPHEFYKKGDLYQYNKNSAIYKLNFDKNGWPVSDYPDYTGYRRRHTAKAKISTAGGTPRPIVNVQKTGTVPQKPSKVKVPIVYFSYNGKTRHVQVISFDDTYLKGLEMTWIDGKYKYQFKSYLTYKICDDVALDSYKPAE